jgi:hypothetical protein
MENNERKAKNSEARIRANNKYTNANYQNINIKIRPEQAEIIRNTAKQLDISIAQLIINSVNEYKTNHGADTDGETVEKPQEENETENEIEREETTEEEEQAAGAEEPQEDTHRRTRADQKRKQSGQRLEQGNRSKLNLDTPDTMDEYNGRTTAYNAGII